MSCCARRRWRTTSPRGWPRPSARPTRGPGRPRRTGPSARSLAPQALRLRAALARPRWLG
eukprot:3769273-Pyramimonas_sp.AAC.1